MENKLKIINYKSEGKEIELKLDEERNIIWATQNEIAKFYNLDRSVIAKYLKEEIQNCTSSGSVCANFAQVATNGKTYKMKHYSLDLISKLCIAQSKSHLYKESNFKNYNDVCRQKVVSLYTKEVMCDYSDIFHFMPLCCWQCPCFTLCVTVPI